MQENIWKITSGLYSCIVKSALFGATRSNSTGQTEANNSEFQARKTGTTFWKDWRNTIFNR